jgi:hypothetical protein
MRKHFIDASFPRSRHAIFHDSAKRDQVRDGSNSAVVLDSVRTAAVG